MTATATAAFLTGDVVTGRPVREGKSSARPKKGVVLGMMTDDPRVLVVWWYGEGVASMDTTTMAYARELTAAGDLWNLGSEAARKMAKRANSFSRARVLTGFLARHADRMALLGL